MKTDNKKKVLIALDYDPTAQKVAEAGFSLARTMKAEVTLIHVIADPVYYSALEYSPITGFAGNMNMADYQLDSIEGLKKASLQYLDKLKKHLGDNTIKTIIAEGDYSDSILKSAKKIHADLIVMGSHSRKWLENIVMGSVTEKVLHHTSIPLFIIPTRKHK